MRRRIGLWAGLLLAVVAVGCRTGPSFLHTDQQRAIDRSIVDYPPGFKLAEFAENLNSPAGFCFDQDGTLFIAEGGADNVSPHIFGRRADGSTIEIYPA